MDIVRIGTVELTKEAAEKLYSEGKYIVSNSKIYQLHYSQAQKRVYGSVIYRSKGSMTGRGRFYAMDGATVNSLVGYNLVNAQ